MKVWWIEDIRKEGLSRIMKFYRDDLRYIAIRIRGNKRIRAKYLIKHISGKKGFIDKIKQKRLEEMIPKCQGYFEIVES